MKKIYINILFIVVMSCFMTSFSYGFSGETIKEIKENLRNLEGNQTELSLETKILNQNEKLKKLFRTDLTNLDLENIKNIIDSYNLKRSIINKTLLVKAQKLEDVSVEKELLILEKRDLYKKLTPYIQNELIPDYLEYIKGDAQLLKEKKEITEKIIVNNKILVNRVNVLEERIKEHKKVLDEKIRNLVEEKILEKISLLENNANFKKLKREQKLDVLEKLIVTIEGKISELNTLETSPDVLEKKQEIYNILLDKIGEFKKRIK